MKVLLSLCLDPKIARRATVVAIVVGTLLNVINHYDHLLAGDLTAKVTGQMLLTYLVPYLVSTHGQVTRISKQLHTT